MHITVECHRGRFVPENLGYFNCSTYNKKSKHLCTSHRIAVQAIEHIVLADLQKVLDAYRADENRVIALLQWQVGQSRHQERTRSKDTGMRESGETYHRAGSDYPRPL